MRAKRLGGVAERDMDLLLLEEFYSSPEFVEWWLEKAKHDHSGSHTLAGAWQSVMTPNGESDLEVDARCEAVGGILRILIEDKVSATAQPEQAQRYIERAERYKARGECQEAVVCITAPRSYLESDSGAGRYPQRVAYEQIHDWFAARRDDPRFIHKAAVVQQAIDQQALGYQPIPVPEIVAFLDDVYMRIALSEFPSLAPTRPGGGEGGGWVFFHPSTLPKGWQLIHKLGHGVVDLHIPKAAGCVQRLRERIGELPGAEKIDVVPAGGSAAFRVYAIGLDKRVAIGQEEAIRSGLAAALELAQLAPKIERIWRGLQAECGGVP